MEFLCRIMQHASHFYIIRQLRQRYLSFDADLHSVLATRGEVAAEGEVGRRRHGAFDRLKPFGFCRPGIR